MTATLSVAMLVVTAALGANSCEQFGNRYTIANDDCTCFRQEDIGNGNHGYHHCAQGLQFSTNICRCTWPRLAGCSHKAKDHDGCSSGVNEINPDMAKLIESTGRFSADLMKQLNIERIAKGEKNIAFSPFSIHIVLAMLYEGARGNTRTQMGSALYYDIVPNLKASYKLLLDSMDEATVNATLLTANRIYPESTFKFLDAYLQVLRDFYRSEVVPSDFLGNADRERQNINAWVEQQTQALIKNLLGPGTISSQTVMVLVNAIYFKGFWKLPFNPNDTVSANFHIGRNRVISIDTMKQRGMFKVISTADYQALSLPYNGNRLQMIVIVPRDFDALDRISNSFSFSFVEDVQNSLRAQGERQVRVSLPKFKVKSKFKLSTTLRDMGIRDLFIRDADLSGMNGRKGLVVSAVIHEAVVDVNEEGTEAAAATAVIIFGSTSLPPEFTVDRPFFFVISVVETGLVLFTGLIGEP